jgi:hypothetical protein
MNAVGDGSFVQSFIKELQAGQSDRVKGWQTVKSMEDVSKVAAAVNPIFNAGIANERVLCEKLAEYIVKNIFDSPALFSFLSQPQCSDLLKGELIKKMLGHSRYKTSEVADRIAQIQNEEARFEVVKMAIEKKPHQIAEKMHSYQLTKAHRLEIATLLAENGDWDYQYTEKFGLDEKEGWNLVTTRKPEWQRLEIVSDALRDGKIAIHHLPQFQLAEESLFHLALLAIPSGVLFEHLEEYHVATEEQQFKFLKFAAKNDKTFHTYINKFSLTGEHLFEIAQLVVDVVDRSSDVFQLLDHLITNLPKDKLFEIAKTLARRHSYRTSMDIKRFQFSEAEQLEIARIALTTTPSSCTFLKNYKLPANSYFELAHLIAHKDASRDAWPFIQDFNLTPLELFEIAKVAVQNYGAYEIAAHIGKFNLTRHQRFEVATLAAKNGYLSASLEIGDKLTKDEEFEMFKLAAPKHGRTASSAIKKQGFTQEQRFSIAQLAAQSTGSLTIKDYDLTRQQRFEVAKIVSQSGEESSSEISYYIRDYDLMAAERYEVAMLIAKNSSGVSLSTWIDKYEMTQLERFEIAQLVAKNNKGQISAYIEKYQLSQDQRFFVAKFAAQENARDVTDHIRYYDLTVKQQFQIAKLIASSHPDPNFPIFAFKFLSSVEAFFILALAGYKNDIQPLTEKYPIKFENLFALLKAEYKKATGKQDSPLFSYVEQEKNPINQMHMITALIHMMGSAFEQEGISDNYPEIQLKVQRLIKDVLEYRDPETRSILSKLFASKLLRQSDQCEAYRQKESEGKREEGEIPSHLSLSLGLLTIFQADGVSQKTCSKLASIIGQGQGRKFFKAAGNRKILIDTLIAIQALPPKALTIQDKENLLLMIIGDSAKSDLKACLKRLNAIKAVINLQEFDSLTTQALNGKDLFSALLAAFQKKIPIPLIENFAEKYEKTFAQYRNPVALLVYASGLQQLPESEKSQTLNALATFVQAVLEDNIKAKRLENSIHLKTVLVNRETLAKQWSENQTIPLSSLSLDGNDILQIDRKKDLKQKIITDRHIDPDQHVILKNWLEDHLSDANAIQEIEEQLKQHPQNEKLLFQLYCVHLSKAKSTEDQLTVLSKMQSVCQSPEFLNDIAAFKNNLQTNLSFEKIKNYQCVFTDNPEDLLLCGTEVLGSCQRVDGSPGLNKCLLAYLLDGKNRLIAIKDESGGKIIARSILRLLWDPAKETPVLMLERIYGADNRLIEKAICSFASTLAKSMQLPIGTYGRSSKESKQMGDIESLSSSAPFEYVDSSGGIQANGIYKIHAPYPLLIT